jgi:membrane protease subunit HflC
VLIIAVAALVVFNLVTFRVYMTEHAVVTRFGDIHKAVVSDASAMSELKKNPRFKDINIVEGKGLFFKLPFIDKVDYYNARLLTYDTDAREVTTRDKKKVILDNFAQWKIVDPVLFRVTMRSEASAYTRLDDIIYSKLNQQIGRMDAEVLISDKDFVAAMLADVVRLANAEIKEFGIEIVDVRIKRTDLPPENNANIFNRMRTERERMAMQYRSEGQEEAQKIRSDAERQATILEAQAYAEAERIRPGFQPDRQQLGFGDDAAPRAFERAKQGDVGILDQQIMRGVAGDEAVDAGAEQPAALDIAGIARRRDGEALRHGCGLTVRRR